MFSAYIGMCHSNWIRIRYTLRMSIVLLFMIRLEKFLLLEVKVRDEILSQTDPMSSKNENRVHSFCPVSEGSNTRIEVWNYTIIIVKSGRSETTN